MNRTASTETCYRCQQPFAAIEWTKHGNTVDTAGGMCDVCLGGDAAEHLTARLLNGADQPSKHSSKPRTASQDLRGSSSERTRRHGA